MNSEAVPAAAGWEVLLVIALAAFLTLFDLDRTFYVPSKAAKKWQLWGWWWSFVVANGALAALVYLWAKDMDSLTSMNPWGRAVVVGLAYLAILRAKVTTFDYQGKPIPAGFELFYEGAKSLVFKRINRIAKNARYDETKAKAHATTLAALVGEARLSITQDALLDDGEKRAAKQWVLDVMAEAAPGNDFDQRATLADYILSGRR